MFDFFLKELKSFGNFLFGHFRSLFANLRRAKSDVPFRQSVYDVIAVLRGTGVFSLLSILALLVFTVLPQGKDVLLIIVEEVANEYRFGNLLFLLIGVFIWSIVSEFGSRYAIAVTDNSGKNIDAQRVEWRKQLQRTAAAIFLMLPYLIVLLGFIINYVQDDSLSGWNKKIGYGVPILCLYTVFSWLSRKYFRAGSTFFSLPKIEQEWCEKLYGIYSDYIFELRKETNFIGYSFQSFEKFISYVREVDKESEYPKNSEEVFNENLVPEKFILRSTTINEDTSKQEKYRWIYSIPNTFYEVLHHRLKLLVIGCLVIFFLLVFAPLEFYPVLGAPALVVLAFASYCGIYIGLLYLDYAKKLYTRISLIGLLLISSYFNPDHPVRYSEKGCCDNRPSLKTHFTNWFEQYSQDSLHTLYRTKSDTTRSQYHPVLFVCVEGGALRTGAFAALTLSFLQDSLARHFDSVDLRKSIYAFSGVSGGSLGVGFFNSVNYLSDPQKDFRYEHADTLTHVFFNHDFLAPVIGTMFYGDVLNDFLPFYIEAFDRASALEKSWENAYTEIAKNNQQNIFSANYQQLYNKPHSYPAMFINTSEAETGLQCWLSNVKLDSSALLFAHQRDLFAYKLRSGINYSTMINFSSRFPFFSPGAAVQQNHNQKFHYLDGGYVENTGCGTMLEVLKELEPEMRRRSIRPYVLVLRYNDEKNAEWNNINFGNEWSEILYGIYNTRNGRSRMAEEQLRIYVDSLKGNLSELPLDKTGSQVPMNWVMSEKSLRNIEADIKKKWESRETNGLKKLLFLQPDECIMCKNWGKAFAEEKKLDSLKQIIKMNEQKNNTQAMKAVLTLDGKIILDSSVLLKK